MTLEAWVAREMLKRLDRVIDYRIPLELLDYVFFKSENERHAFFDTVEDAMKWAKMFHKDIEGVIEELEVLNGLTAKEISELRKKPNEWAMLVVNHVAAGILMGADADWEEPVVWTRERLSTSFLGNFME